MSSVAVIANTQKLVKKDARALRRALADAGLDDVQWMEIERGSDAKKAAQKALKHDVQTVIVCGGDGSVRAAAEALVGSAVALSVVPSGTANLFATGLDLPTDIDDIVKVITSGDRRSIDSATCNGKTFNVMAGSGFDVAMLAHAEDDKERMGTLAYVRAGVDQVRHRKLFDAKVSIDGKAFYDGEASCVLVGKLGSLKGGIKTFPDASPTDGQLHVAVVTAAGAREWAGLMVSAVMRRPQASSHAEMGAGTEVEVTFDGKRRFELDGGVKGKAKKLEFGINPRSLVICALPA
jgi:YegS/Rv2252/BmrU family lipid kinase